jgi:hypothetical protein
MCDAPGRHSVCGLLQRPRNEYGQGRWHCARVRKPCDWERAWTRSPRKRKMAEREGFEPPCRLPDKTLSRRPRYDHFGTSPCLAVAAEHAIIPCGSAVTARALRPPLFAEKLLQQIARFVAAGTARDREAMIQARRVERARG